MKKIGIITIVKCNNYGAELQAYASVQVLSECGYDAEVIDYLYFKNPGYIFTPESKPLLPQSLKTRVANTIKYRIATKVLYGVLPIISKKIRIRNGRFNSFHSLNTKMSPTFCCMKELYENVGKYDVYVAGSDQLWNPYTEINLAPYFLQFAPKGSKKISFASSFGVSEIPDFAILKYSEWLNQFDHLSCREDAGAGIIRKLIGKNASHVLDPTLLLSKDQWLKIKGAEIEVPERFVLIYETRPSAYIHKIATIYSQEHNCPILRLCLHAIGNRKDDSIFNIENAGPADFVMLFSKASLVLTNSFHGTAFACNFGKDFYCVLSKGNKKNSRMISLLDKINLNDRIIWEEEVLIKELDFGYNYERSMELLDFERQKTIAFLRRAIEY